MKTVTDGIDTIARRGIALVEDLALRHALDAAYDTPLAREAAVTARRVFERLTSRRWPDEPLCRFLNGWRSTHVTALYVSGLMIRLHRRAEEAGGEASLKLRLAAAEVGEIIPEDTGVDDTPHSELYVEFANYLAGHDRWQLTEYAAPECEEFRRYVKEQRLQASIEEGILTTAASENWNTGEYTFFDRLILPWMTDVLGRPSPEAEEKAAYVTVHAGETELGHFLHAVGAWKLYCSAVGRPADPLRAKGILDRYLGGVGRAFAELERVLTG